MKISKHLVLVTGCHSFFFNSGCRDVAKNCRGNESYCTDVHIDWTYKWCRATCRTCNKQRPQSAAPQQPASPVQTAQQYQQVPTKNFGSLFAGMQMPENDRGWFSERTKDTKSTYRPFAEVNSDVANSWYELEYQNVQKSKNIADWNSKGYFDYRRNDWRRRTGKPTASPHMSGKQGVNPYGNSFNGFKSLFHRGGNTPATSTPAPTAAPTAAPTQPAIIIPPRTIAPTTTEAPVECRDVATNCEILVHRCDLEYQIRENYCKMSCGGCTAAAPQPAQPVQQFKTIGAVPPLSTFPRNPGPTALPISQDILDAINSHSGPIHQTFTTVAPPVVHQPVAPVLQQLVPQLPPPQVVQQPAAPIAPPVVQHPVVAAAPPVLQETVAGECVDAAIECSIITLDMCKQPFMAEMRKKCPKTCDACGGEKPEPKTNERTVTLIAPPAPSVRSCEDTAGATMCTQLKQKVAQHEQLKDMFCNSQSVWMNCPRTCNKCAEVQNLPSCMDTMPSCTSDQISSDDLCKNPTLKLACKQTCGMCTDSGTPVVQPEPVVVSAPPAPVVTTPAPAPVQPHPGCTNNYPELCKIKANTESCKNENLWKKCGSSCHRCSETAHLKYECKDMNEMCQTELMTIGCKTKSWVREACPVSCGATAEFCEQPKVVEPVSNYQPVSDMSPNCKTVWKENCHIDMFKRACPESCP